MTRIAVLGAGAWGTALALAADRAGCDVVLWGRDRDALAEIARTRQNERYLKGVTIPDQITLSASMPEAVTGADAVLAVVPAQTLRATLAALTDLSPGIPVIACCKGLEHGTGALMTDVIRECLPDNPAMALSGPSFATDVAAGLPTAVVLAATTLAEAEHMATTLSSPVFRIYASDDPIGVETGGALKNVLAIAAGATAGQGLGSSATAAIIARGFAEMRRFAATTGAKADTLMGLSGLGDLILTCSGTQSRNYAFGLSLGKGATAASLLEAGQPLAEGAHTARIAATLGAKRSIDMPITDAVAAVIDGSLDIASATQALLARPLKAE